MGQYFRPVNTDKKEFVCPWCIKGGAKLWEWAANKQGSIFTLLLRKSDGSGGGDFFGYHKGYGEGSPVHEHGIVGRWAGDRVMLVGDYDTSEIYQAADGYRNVSEELVEAWNGFIELPEMQLTFEKCGCHEPDLSPTEKVIRTVGTQMARTVK